MTSPFELGPWILGQTVNAAIVLALLGCGHWLLALAYVAWWALA